jgi:hypothetical protein
MRDRGGRRLLAGAVALAGLLVPAGGAAAQERPVVSTGGTTNVTPTTVTLNGSVNPKGGATTYFFQYGTTSIYGATTPATSAGRGNRRVRALANVAGLAPFTRYHYRIVAQKGNRLVKGRDRTFRTLRQPLGVTLGGSPNPVRTGRATTLAGVLSGTGSAGRQVILQANPFPYTQGFLTIANPQVTTTTGSFAFPILSQSVSTQYRVLMPNKPEVVSPIVIVGTSVRVTTRTSTRRGRRSGRIRFRGTISPAVDGSEVLIQKWRNGNWRNVGRTFARNAGSKSSRYTKRIRQRRGGRFRVLANLEGEHVPSAGHTKRLRVRRR